MSVAVPVVAGLRIDQRRGTAAMWLFIISEALLFLMLFFTYYYLQHEAPSRWHITPPKLTLAFVMLGLLTTSSIVVHSADKKAREGASAVARALIALAIMLGIAFLVVQWYEFAERLKEIKPTTNAYGSVFYAITSLHAAHVILGLLMLGYVACLPELAESDRPPHRPLHNVGLYWHFVDIVWVIIVALLYVAPRWGHL